jgi:hypothetical protein
MWSGADLPTVIEDAAAYKKLYNSSGQFVLSRTNHHIHLKDSKTGERVPLNACIAKKQKKKKIKECKHGFHPVLLSVGYLMESQIGHRHSQSQLGLSGLSMDIH